MPSPKDEMSMFMSAQVKEIERHKWIESEKVGHDLGDSAVRDWISKHAKEFREKFEAENDQYGKNLQGSQPSVGKPTDDGSR